jgi:arylformamidase
MTRRFIDLSHAVESGVSGYPGLPAPRIEPFISHAASRPQYGGLAEFEISRLFLVGNTGTYLDSPYHRFPGAADIAQVPLESIAGLAGQCIAARYGPDGRAVELDLPADIAGAAVLIRTGWDQRWGTPRYWEPGPYLTGPSAELLVAAGVRLIGVDCWNVDDTRDPARPVHTVLLAAGIPVVEHLTNLAALGVMPFRFFAVPAPIRGAASLPVRAFADIADGGM